jgi:outer membrane protein TolC
MFKGFFYKIFPLGYSTSSTTQIFPVWTASISQPLYIFIRNQSLRTRKEAHLSWENSQDNYRSQRLAIEFEARQLYYNAIVQSQTIEIERKKLESASLVNDVTKALVQAGKLAEVELVRASIRAKKDQRNMKNSEIQYEQLINQLKDLILLPRDTDIQLVTPLSYRPFKLSLDELIQTALAKNPSLRIAERQIKLSEFSLQRTQESNRPSFNATGSYSLTQDRTDDTLSLDPYTWNVKLGMDWAFFDATQTRLKTQQEQVSLENNKRSFELQERDLIVSVKNAYLDIKRIEEQISEFEAQRKSAQSNVNAMRLQYRNGLTRLTDVFDAENQLRELELEYLGLLRDFNSAQDRIKTLIGSDLQDSQG